ncbi:hypothetical protein GCM10017673_49720 [Streptosporangium violaceochromogenes]|nr:hypothetical protein GCM10017673_49720 [Streptosporangium violaceochromogenes]
MRVAAGLIDGDPRCLGGYRLAGRLGAGRRGVVYEAYGPGGRRVVVRVPHGGPGMWGRLAGQVAKARCVAPFCTASVIDAGLDGPRPYIVSEYVAGPSLRGAGRVLAGDDLRRLATAVATALAACHHAGVVHRGLTPDTVLLGPEGPRVIGLGTARPTAPARARPGAVGGVPAYTAPETFTGGEAGAPADVFAWGAITLYAATGEDPFTAESLGAVMHRVLSVDPDLGPLPGPLRALVAAALAKDPLARPSARELLLALVRLDAGPAAGRVLAGRDACPQRASSRPGRPVGSRRAGSPLIDALLAVEAPLTMDFLLAAGDRVAAGLRTPDDGCGPAVPGGACPGWGAAPAAGTSPQAGRRLSARARLVTLAVTAMVAFALVAVVLGGGTPV